MRVNQSIILYNKSFDAGMVRGRILKYTVQIVHLEAHWLLICFHSFIYVIIYD